MMKVKKPSKNKKFEKTTRKVKTRTEEEKWSDYIKQIKNKNKLNDLVEKNLD